MQMARVAMGLALLVAVGAAFSLPLSAAVSKGELCKLSGARYAGKTSQGKSVCFTLTRTGRISEYAYVARDSCGGVTSRTTSKTGIPVSSAGSFSTTFGQSFFKGRIAGTRASGTLRASRTDYSTIPSTTCDSGVLRWNATRKS